MERTVCDRRTWPPLSAPSTIAGNYKKLFDVILPTRCFYCACVQCCCWLRALHAAAPSRTPGCTPSPAGHQLLMCPIRTGHCKRRNRDQKTRGNSPSSMHSRYVIRC